MASFGITAAVDALRGQWTLLVERVGVEKADQDSELRLSAQAAWGRPLHRGELIAAVEAQARRVGRMCCCGGWGHLPRWAAEVVYTGFQHDSYSSTEAMTPVTCLSCRDAGDGMSLRDLQSRPSCSWCQGSGLAPIWTTNAPFGDLSCSPIGFVRGWFPSWCCVCGGFGRLAPPRPPDLARVGDGWLLGFGGNEAFVRDLRGVHYIARVLEASRHEVRALDLVDRSAATASVSFDDGLQVRETSALLDRIDRSATDAYRQRLRDLESALNEAQERGDERMRARLEAEQDALIHELTRARHGEADDARRARDSVSRAIRVAIGAIDGVHPELAAHLRDTLELGSVIRYRP